MKYRTLATILVIVFMFTITTLLIISSVAEKEIVYKDCFDKFGNKIMEVTCEDKVFVSKAVVPICIILTLSLFFSGLFSVIFMMGSMGER